MLVLSRREEETIVIGGDIKISFLRVKGHTIRVGIEAPRDVTICRGELVPLETNVDVKEPQPV